MKDGVVPGTWVWRAGGQEKEGRMDGWDGSLLHASSKVPEHFEFCTRGGRTDAHRQLAIKLHSFESSAPEYLYFVPGLPTCNKCGTVWCPWKIPWAGREDRSWEGFARAIGDLGVGWRLPVSDSGVFRGVGRLTQLEYDMMAHTVQTLQLRGVIRLWLAGGELASAYVLLSHMPRAFYKTFRQKREFFPLQ